MKHRNGPFSRRAFLGTAVVLAGGAAMGALGACQAPAPAATNPPAASQPTTAPASAPTSAAARTSVPAAAPKATERPKVMRISYATDINFLDPALVQSGPEWIPQYLIYDTLVRYDQTMMDPKPGLAESWTNSDEGTKWVFKVRRGVKFHTGRELKASDIEYSWRRAIDVGAKGRATGNLSSVASFEASGEYEFTVKLKAFSWDFLPNTATGSVAVVDKDTAANLSTKPVGTGPYKFVEWSQGQHVVYEKFGDYWDKALSAKLPDQVKTIVIPEIQTAIANLKSGTVDVVTTVPPQFRKDLEQTPGMSLIRQKPFSAAYECFDFGLNEPPFKGNATLRKAVARAIDRATISKNAYFSEGEVDCNLIPKTHWAYTPLDCDQTSFNLEEAKKLLVQAGQPNGFEFTIHIISSDPIQVKTAEIIQEDLKKIGVQMKINALDSPIWVRDIFLKKTGQAVLAGYTREPDPNGLFSSVLRKDQGNNWMGYHEPEIEALFDRGVAERDQQKRIPIYKQIMEKAILQDIPVVKLYARAEAWAANQHVKGLTLLPKGYPNLWEWSWE